MVLPVKEKDGGSPEPNTIPVPKKYKFGMNLVLTDMDPNEYDGVELPAELFDPNDLAETVHKNELIFYKVGQFLYFIGELHIEKVKVASEREVRSIAETMLGGRLQLFVTLPFTNPLNVEAPVQLNFSRFSDFDMYNRFGDSTAHVPWEGKYRISDMVIATILPNSNRIRFQVAPYGDLEPLIIENYDNSKPSLHIHVSGQVLDDYVTIASVVEG
ncbi:MAG: DUF1007 family protein [Okeania sp. SIO3B5]|uniref:hypothetical protein n=1 Tax=Okeania sp. SIO3B5 TaxID=2607811 RepID=UPI0014019351|nr:hypothetical protein [Okeania sp. SIO3B5]NEO56579.1 DUF1007 family protein [Okeania sp. SIO3B5]